MLWLKEASLSTSELSVTSEEALQKKVSISKSVQAWACAVGNLYLCCSEAGTGGTNAVLEEVDGPLLREKNVFSIHNIYSTRKKRSVSCRELSLA